MSIFEELIDSAWSEKYRPKTLSDCIIPDDLRRELEHYLADKYILSAMFVGSPGIGKTSVAKAILNDIDADYIMINGSREGIDTLRTTVQQFASTISQTKDGRKYVIIDEADRMSQQFQDAFRGVFEEYSLVCGFILTANYPDRIMREIHSRCPPISFKIPKSEQPKIATQYLNRACEILDKEKVSYEKAVIAAIVRRYFPDFRRTLNELQRLSSKGDLDTSALGTGVTEWEVLYKALKAKNFSDMRKWVSENNNIELNTFFRRLYDELTKHVIDMSIPQLILLIADYQYKMSMVSDPEILMAALLIEIMSNMQWKK